jgi:predicted transcriptional regulator
MCVSSIADDLEQEIDRQIAEGIAAEERGELHDGEEAMAEILAELEARRDSG